MEKELLKEAFAALEKAAVEKNRSGILDALRRFRMAYGKRCDLIDALGINQSTWTRWQNGTGLNGMAAQLHRFRRLVGQESPSCPQVQVLPSEAMLQALVATKNSSLDCLQLLLRMRDAAGFDLSVELYEKVLGEFELQKS